MNTKLSRSFEITQLRIDAKSQLARMPPSEKPGRPASEFIHELQVYQIELEMQNEALHQAQMELEESRDRFADLYEFAPAGYLTLSASGLIVGINLSGASLLREDRAKLLDRRFTRFVVSEDQDRWERHLLCAFRDGGKHVCDLSLRLTDGTSFVACLDSLLIVPGNAAPMLRISVIDVTERKRAEEELRIAAIVFESPEGMIVTDTTGAIVRVNRAFTRMTGYSAEEIIGQTSSLLKSGRQDNTFYQRMWRTLKENDYWQGEIWNRRKNGNIYAEWLTISAVTAPDGATTHYVGSFSDMTQKKEAEANIHRLAYYDPLTNLPNRRLFHDRLGQALAGRNRSGHHGALLFLDLDNFKALNDTRGHDVGDQLLINTARCIQANLRKEDTVARLGGDEFVVMLEDLGVEAQEAAAQASLVAEKIRQSLAQPCDLDGREFHYTISLGIAIFHEQDESPETLLKQAELAMYKAKDAGRDAWRFFNPAMQVAQDERSALEADLHLALKHRQLHLYFQAQIDGARRVIGAEALLRWLHPERGMISPLDFIPLAEETGLILRIGQWVLETACTQIKAWSANADTRDLRLAINVSAREFHQPEFVAQVRQVLSQTGADPTRLKIELTESLMINNVAETIDRMQILKGLGIGFSMDDFGTGYSSLAYLKLLPLDQLKIDRSFINDIASNSNDAAIVQTIISMGRTLGLDVIAEGVETESQLECLYQYGCTAFQGFLFSRPLPLDAFENYIQRAVCIR